MQTNLTKRQKARLSGVFVAVVMVSLFLLWQNYCAYKNSGACNVWKDKYAHKDELEGEHIDTDLLPRFTKISKTGEKIHPWSGPWACVWDNVNRIYWEVKTDDETIHDGYWSFSWMVNGEGVGDMGDCYILERRCDTQDLIAISNREQHCGRTHWRLPSAKELRSLLYRPDRLGAVKVNSALFPNIKRGDYWTVESTSQKARAYNFLHNHLLDLPKANAAFTILVSE
ncbi:DUF1566 domain-containing protein [Exilibacterium tricleocarpae]|uniref:DUF1566 domain-containing protein n=1 Tax=Exilibacterium tricleocarpae TaxID=2591008 RepID=A0A545SNF0_9GAMM|nr:DUF1566 domain-containing protein [Exilibacterium tricleocarpae]TQV66484.1 DUF1566 domain-containing protein [Exilibacterium tricleocarpae]